MRAGDTLVVWRLDRLGRKPKLDARQIIEVKRLMSDQTIPVGQIVERYKVSRITIYKVAPYWRFG